jgi:hypothetical protein
MNHQQVLSRCLFLSLFNYAFASLPVSLANETGPSLHANNTQCQIYPTTIESWNQLGVDTFLSTVPGGKDAALEDFTFANHITNFVCGLGENCLAGQVGDLSIQLNKLKLKTECSSFVAVAMLTLPGTPLVYAVLSARMEPLCQFVI